MRLPPAKGVARVEVWNADDDVSDCHQQAGESSGLSSASDTPHHHADHEDGCPDRQDVEQRERDEVRDWRHHVLQPRIEPRRIPPFDDRWAQRRKRAHQRHDNRARLDPSPHRHRLYERNSRLQFHDPMSARLALTLGLIVWTLPAHDADAQPSAAGSGRVSGLVISASAGSIRRSPRRDHVDGRRGPGSGSD